MKTLTTFLALAFIAALSSCGKQECQNTNTAFYTNEPASAIYKKALIKELDKGGSYYCVLTRYEEEGSLPVFHIDIHGKGLCAKAEVTVPLPDETAARIIEAKGKGYYGSEIENLDFDFNAEKNLFVYRTADDIID